MITKRYKGGFALAALYLSLSTAVQATTHINPTIDSNYLGWGIDSNSGLLKENCISGTLSETGNTAVNMGMQYAITASESLEEVTGSVSAKVNLGLCAGGVSVDMHTRLEENSNTASFVYRVRYRAGTKTVENRDYTQLGLNVLGESAEEIIAECGDEFINSVELGSDLYLVTQMQFASKGDYEKYVTEIKVRVLFWSRTDTITTETYSLAENGRYSVKAVSSVPLPQDIIDILGSSGEKHCAVSSSSMPECVTAANNVLEYLVGPNSDYQSYLEDPANLTVVSFNSMPYDEAGHFALASDPVPISPVLEGLQEDLMNPLSDNLVKRNITRAYSSVSPQFQALDDDVNQNIALLQAALDACRNTPDETSCRAARDAALAQLIAVDIDI